MKRLLLLFLSAGLSCGYAVAGNRVEPSTQNDDRSFANTDDALNIEMVYVEGGTFTMGAPDTDSEADSDEKPAHSVTLSGYYIGKYEVTQKQWVDIMGSNPSRIKGNNLPVTNVRCSDIQEFIFKLNSRTGKSYRLPTEAEWEFAARGGNSSRGYKYSGSDNIDDVAWYKENSGRKVHAVGLKAPNELGIYDMTGNVREWCQDWCGDYSSVEQVNPQGPSMGAFRAFRGGSVDAYAVNCRVSFRNGSSPENRYGSLGFRLVEIVPEVLDIEMVRVDGGAFIMGASASDSELSENEEAFENEVAHRVTLSGYYIGKYEVTQKQWIEVMGNNPSEFKGDDLPVTNVSWNDVQEFIRRLNLRTCRNYRLPTEAEWEFAARGGNSSLGSKYSGDDDINAVAWYKDNSDNKPHAVGSKSPNELGIYDMTGNVWEWCQDRFGRYGSSAQTNPKGPSSGDRRVLRGGGWSYAARSNRVSYRFGVAPGYRVNSYGFRLALSE